MNLHGGTIVSNIFSASFGAILLSVRPGSAIIAELFLFVTILAFILSLAFIIRFFINFRKYREVLHCPPYQSPTS